ncbi:MAG: primosomal protein N' [Acidobacteriota bacterium]|nr:primosomal protein N' [Acidobacteriota bacterium]
MTEPPESPVFVEVAVPLPLTGTLTYAPRDGTIPLPGCRVRVQVGSRRVIGMVIGAVATAPDGVTVRPFDRIVDPHPVIDTSLLELARFVSDYYLAPIGEVLQSIVPAALEPWGERRVWLTDAGALGTPADADEALLIDALRAHGRMKLADLEAEATIAKFTDTVDQLTKCGKIAIGESKVGGSRFVAAIEVASGQLDDLVERCGRSQPARDVVEYLAGLQRPSTVRETLSVVGCSRGVITRLVGLGVLRQFSQLARLDLGRHVLRTETSDSIVLNDGQSTALRSLLSAVESGVFGGFLLQGLTGSGKTEVYVRAAEAAVTAGRSAIILVPEIALVPVLAATLRERFDSRLAILHSALGRAERQQEWERIRRGEATVVLGPRSAVFAPVGDLGLIVVDEEQDAAYKQENTPRYHARDVALYRGRAAEAVVVLASATPSLESRFNAENGKLDPLTLVERVAGGSLPEGILVDLRGEKPKRPGEVYFSPRLLAELEETLAAGDQAILLRNRRGYSPLLLCRACGDESQCEQCGLARTYHRRFAELLCHYCGSRRPVPAVCRVCGEDALEPIGTGTERVEEELQQLFPAAAIDTLDRDALRRKGHVVGVLERFARGETQMLVGTQMVSKGHHFPRVALAAVLHADTYLGFPDFRAVERTYALLTQLAGRAGRGHRPGRIVIQTFHPDHYAIQAALDHDDRRFAEEEMRFRRMFHYPPYTRMVQLLVRGTHRQRTEEEARTLGQKLESHPLARGLRILGPSPAPFERLRGKWRFQLLLRGRSGRRVRSLVRDVAGEGAGSQLVIDVDPQELL